MVRWTGNDRTRARSMRARACSNRTKDRSNRTRARSARMRARSDRMRARSDRMRARSDRMRARTVDVCVGQARRNVVGHDSGGCYRESSCGCARRKRFLRCFVSVFCLSQRCSLKDCLEKSRKETSCGTIYWVNHNSTETYKINLNDSPNLSF
jgi:hypothetical protein